MKNTSNHEDPIDEMQRNALAFHAGACVNEHAAAYQRGAVKMKALTGKSPAIPVPAGTNDEADEAGRSPAGGYTDGIESARARGRAQMKAAGNVPSITGRSAVFPPARRLQANQKFDGRGYLKAVADLHWEFTAKHGTNAKPTTVDGANEVFAVGPLIKGRYA